MHRSGAGVAAGRHAGSAIIRSALIASTIIGACLLATGCQSLGLRHDARGGTSTTLDGLPLPARPSATTREVVSMLALDTQCRNPGPDCAERILDAPGTVRAATRLIAASDMLFLHARRASGSTREAAFFRCGRLTYRYLFEQDLPGRKGALDARSQMAFRLHNACTAGLVRAVAGRPGAIGWDVDERRFPRQAVRRIEIADALHVHGLRTRQVEDGIGAAAVAFGETVEPIGAFPAQPFALAITVRLVVDARGDTSLVATDASREQSLDTAFGAVPLARDMSAAYASAAVAFEEERSMWQLLRGAAGGDDAPQLRLLAPFDDAKTPVVLVHGFASSPMTWANMVNELLGDPDISQRYQFWMARYPTHLPVLVNRQELARSITAFRARARPSPLTPQPPMVIVGHSMGGVLARLLVTDPGTTLWDAAFLVPPAQLQGTVEDIAAVRDLFMFEPLGEVDEVVFIAAPHGGSEAAEGWLARVLRTLIKAPADALSFLARVAATNSAQVRPEVRENYRQGGPDSLATLSPRQPVIHAARGLPTVAGVRVSSIIGIADPRAPEKGDGVVTLESAAWPTGTEYRIRGRHDLHALPETIAVLKRILLERLMPSVPPVSTGARPAARPGAAAQTDPRLSPDGNQ